MSVCKICGRNYDSNVSIIQDCCDMCIDICVKCGKNSPVSAEGALGLCDDCQVDIKADIDFHVSNNIGSMAWMVDSFSGPFIKSFSFFLDSKARCEHVENFEKGTWMISFNYHLPDGLNSFHTKYFHVNVTEAIRELDKVRNDSDFNRNKVDNEITTKWG